MIAFHPAIIKLYKCLRSSTASATVPKACPDDVRCGDGDGTICLAHLRVLQRQFGVQIVQLPAARQHKVAHGGAGGGALLAHTHVVAAGKA